MPKVGDKEFPYTDKGYKQAAQESSETGIPVSNGAERNITTYAGGGKTGYNAIGNPMYKEGGKVMDIPGEQVKWASEKEKKKGFKPSKKGKFFSKEKRAKRKAKRQERRDKRQGVVKKVETKAGDYKVYKKDSKKAKSFREAFKAAKGKDFTWDGRKYSGKTKEQAAKSKAKPDKSLGMKPKKAAIKTPKPKDFKKTKKVSPALGPVNKPKKESTALGPIDSKVIGPVNKSVKEQKSKSDKPKPKYKKRRKIDVFGFRDAKEARSQYKKGGKVNTSPKGKKIPKGSIASSLRQRANIKKSERIKGKKPAPPFSTRFGSSILDEDKK
jgi:hypothetical protein